jgi:hypothetical protein
LKCRVLDGYGYYHGFNKRRFPNKTIAITKMIDPKELHAYDMGLVGAYGIPLKEKLLS